MQCAMTTSPRATPLVHKEQELSMSWMPATSDINVHSATTSDDNAPAADEIESSPSPDYFGLNLEQRRASIMDAGLFSNSSARNFGTGFPTQPINPAVTHNMSATTTSTTIHTAANSNGFNFDRPALDLNSFQIQSVAQRRPPMNRFNTAPSNVKLVSSRAPANGDTCSPRSSAHASAQEGRTFPTEMEGVSPTTEQPPARPTYPTTIMPTFAHSGSTKPETIAEATETPMEVDSSPLFSNPAPFMNLSLPPGRDFSKMFSQTPQTPVATAVQKTKSRPTMNIEIPPSVIQLKVSPRIMKLDMPGGILGVGKPATPKPESKINSVCASSVIPHDTPVSTVAKTKMFATMNFIDGQVLYNLMRTKPEHVLILDVRCARNYAASHLRGALNLCVPTMLLKRDRFKLKQLLESFQKPSDAAKLEKWKECTTVVAYGSCSSDKSEVTIAQNVLNKFVKEGFTGRASVLKGGFNTFSESFEDQIQDASEEAEDENDKSGSGNKPLPVFGGVNIPTDNHPAVSFFNSIRQHTRIGTAPQQLQLTPVIAISDRRLPQWLDTICQKEAGKIIAQSFFNIEMEEQNRMRAALTLDMPGAHLTKSGVRFAGFEKGSKNRYKDVLPYDHTRVKLGGKCVCDYINASYIKAKRSNKRYIATQGPLPATFEDFWSVVWDNDVRVIINLTADKERGHIKCHPYWNEDRYGSITVKKVSEHTVSLDLDPESHKPLRTRANTTMSYEDNPPLPTAADEESTVIIRYLAVTHAMKPFEPLREVVQIHYSGWPDLGTTNPSHILALVELANIISRQLSNPETAHQEAAVAWQDDVETETSARPMLIHCSAGCGRTGTFCTIDSVIDMMKRQRMEQDRELAAQRSPADTAATTIAENLGIKAPMSPRTANNSGVGSMASVFGMHAQQNRSRSNSRRGSVTPVSGPLYPPLDLRYMGDSSIDLIQWTVNDFREQRLNMVQTLRQYVLCYKVVWEWMARLHDRRSESNIIGARIKLRRQSVNGALPPQ